MAMGKFTQLTALFQLWALFGNDDEWAYSPRLNATALGKSKEEDKRRFPAQSKRLFLLSSLDTRRYISPSLLYFNFCSCRFLVFFGRLEHFCVNMSRDSTHLLYFCWFLLQIERELILSTDKSGSKVPIKQYPRQIPTTPVAFNRSSISNGNGAASGVIQQFLPKSSTAVAPDHPTPIHAWVSREILSSEPLDDWRWIEKESKRSCYRFSV